MRALLIFVLSLFSTAAPAKTPASADGCCQGVCCAADCGCCETGACVCGACSCCPTGECGCVK